MFKWLTMPYYVAHDPGGSYEILYDDVYLAGSPARVEIGDSSSWDNCTNREIQEGISWTDTSITFRIRSTVSIPDGAYLYVINSDNEANSSATGMDVVRPLPPVLD